MANINKGALGPLAAGVTGVIIGAGVGAVATKILSDKQTRGKIMKVITDTREKIADSVDAARKKLMEKKEEVEHKVKQRERDRGAAAAM